MVNTLTMYFTSYTILINHEFDASIVTASLTSPTNEEEGISVQKHLKSDVTYISRMVKIIQTRLQILPAFHTQ